jgi:hypothetical protein
MKRTTIQKIGMALAVLIATAGSIQASGPDKEGHSTSKSTQKVSETELKAKMVGAGTQAAAKGYAESKVVTVTNTTTNVSTTNSSLSISIKKLTLTDGSVVTFQLNGKALGTGTVKSGRAGLSLSTKRGNTVPAVATGDTVSVLDPDGSTVDLSGKTGAAITESEGGGDKGGSDKSTDGKEHDGKEHDGKEHDEKEHDEKEHDGR